MGRNSVHLSIRHPSKALGKVSEVQLEGSEGQHEGSDGLLEGSKGLPLYRTLYPVRVAAQKTQKISITEHK